MPLTAERVRSKHPFELYMLGSSAFYSVLGFFASEAQPGSVQETIGHLGTQIWLASVALGCLVALVGVFWRRPATGLFLEGSGCLSAGAATLYFAAVVVYQNGGTAVAAASVMVGFGAACLVRTRQIHRTFVKARRDQLTALGG